MSGRFVGQALTMTLRRAMMMVVVMMSIALVVQRRMGIVMTRRKQPALVRAGGTKKQNCLYKQHNREIDCK